MTMFRIRRIHDNLRQVNQAAITQVEKILEDQFPLLAKSDVEKTPNSCATRSSRVSARSFTSLKMPVNASWALPAATSLESGWKRKMP
jgi:hypothetical protein